MLTVDAKGVFPIAPTPFLADGAIDMSSVDRMIDHYVAAGADGCTILGIMGEAPKLDQDEAIGFVARCVKRAPKLPAPVSVRLRWRRSTICSRVTPATIRAP
jgi:4-hydroxy-tetrahydrodipicolinate synthase